MLGEPGKPAAFGNVQKPLTVASEPALVQVTVQLTVAPEFTGFGVHTTELVISAVPGGGASFTGTVVLELLLPCCATASLLAAVVAGTKSVPAATGVKLTVQPRVPFGATLLTGEHTGVGAPGRPLVLIEQVALVAVAVPMLVQTAVQVTGAPTMPGVGEQLTVLTMSGVFGFGAATMVTVVVPGLLPVAAGGSLIALVLLLTMTAPG